MGEPGPSVGPPFGLLAELTHRCPLRCAYCSNPLQLVPASNELDTDQWRSVLDQARRLGVLQVHLSGGEPMARRDLPALVEHAHSLGCYVNLVTSGLSLTDGAAAELVAAGLDHVQLSIQDADTRGADAIAGARAHERKLAAAAVVRRLGLPLTVNVVLHRGNLDHVEAIVDLAERMGADRLELANTQFYGWALRNRAALLPTAAQLRAADVVVRDAVERLAGRMEISYVYSDYHERRPKPCMHGWGSRQLTVAPNGDVLPCPAASVIEGLDLENVRTRPLAEIWYESASFNAFRGTDWMREPCRSCAFREVDLGGCRCQAFLLTGDAANTDPVCQLSPHRAVVDRVLAEDVLLVPPPSVPRRMPVSRNGDAL
ncbi:pyrroloquinoline quinone biosynthesis protein E [Streptoalloteichus tenebrarius]|uniref:PqqA peptide cyclase n=1 Tax=Streptoalloteichus tenebrarius (strain ATCC 17920 / DSM 40477 / JCM 4838 / CBS 697.72 / NBRC 16177 / NCIMB 11028 / NRRL B-12390 / A12253. 1 / ISP 5477) TaxID=1933 RepID=A0ABT1HTX6_STRSD|nr:pyrroloquinoline quinone biosynthesis protein PqqE [Streptoalloteichus tenebrarius]MCP2258969.1 pyrroloquinoline quinone biosynthesis protein E [Streptoalloteichus tenebrarius]BFF01178.1 pyrroloquinoline quinone biosynthesis protein PqqE [Streptoalloteichus tenebrarius]